MKRKAIQAFREETGTYPDRTAGIVRYVAPDPKNTLSCKTRWDLIDTALREKKIRGLEGFETLKALTAHIASVNQPADP